mmetsp:Transcript_9960/g.15145  ORF Transcript_9960/g.15145 Transcript_9960/m.15145 type:complete len:163 (+) Transcript_9960:1763-2251(+)
MVKNIIICVVLIGALCVNVNALSGNRLIKHFMDDFNNEKSEQYQPQNHLNADDVMSAKRFAQEDYYDYDLDDDADYDLDADYYDDEDYGEGYDYDDDLDDDDLSDYYDALQNYYEDNQMKHFNDVYSNYMRNYQYLQNELNQYYYNQMLAYNQALNNQNYRK